MEQRTDPGHFGRLYAQLNNTGRRLLSYLIEHRHASIDELADATGATTHAEFLLAIREYINPLSQELLGFPALYFAETRYDPAMEKSVCFEWWLDARLGWVGWEDRGRPDSVDVFEDDDSVTLVVDTAGMADLEDPADLEFKVLPGTVSLGAGTADFRCITLPSAVLPVPVQRELNNGMLTIKLRKASTQKSANRTEPKECI